MAAIPTIDLDHVAVALERQADAWPRYGGELSARWFGGGGTAGFASAQVVYGNGMKVEVLEPYLVEQNDFLRRFLDRNGPGPHHLTFKVGDLREALELAEAAGYRPVGVNLGNSWWMEAFLHPKDAPGVVVQLAQTGEGGDWGGDATPSWYPAARTPEPASLVHVAHAVADLDEGLRLFAGLLAGREVGRFEHDGITAVDLAWPGPGRVRLVSGAPLEAWLGGRSGRVHHLAFTATEPAAITDAKVVGDDVVEVAPDANFGVRLVVAADAGPFATLPLGYVEQVPNLKR